MAWESLVKTVALGLKPPRRQSTYASDEHRAWMWSVAIVSGISTMALSVHVALACGLLPSVFPGFLNAGEFAKVQQERAAEREANLETQILQLVERKCVSSGEVRASYTRTLQKLRVEYIKVTGRDYPLPSCEGFGVPNG